MFYVEEQNGKFPNGWLAAHSSSFSSPCFLVTSLFIFFSFWFPQRFLLLLKLKLQEGGFLDFGGFPDFQILDFQISGFPDFRVLALVAFSATPRTNYI